MGIDIDHWEEKPIMYFKGQIARNYVMETNNIKKKNTEPYCEMP